MSKQFFMRIFIVPLILLSLLFQLSCSKKDASDLGNSTDDETVTMEDQSSAAGEADVQKGGSGKAGVFRIIHIYPDSPYWDKDSGNPDTEWIAFQILSINDDGSIGTKHNFIPEYEVNYDGEDNLVIKIKGKPIDEYEEVNMDLSNSLYLSSFEKTISDDYITYEIKTKTTIRFKVVEYYLNFIDFYIEVAKD